jgi:nucleoside-diphosphate-sugar epimerase
MTDGIGKVAVLGGSGFIGHAIVEELIRHGYRVTTVNRGQTPVSWPGPVECITADRRDASRFARALATVDADCIIDVTAYKADETRIAIDAFRNRVGRFIHISTLSVYRWPFPCPVAEDGPLETDPFNHYGFHKAGCERAILSEPVEGLPWTILRLPAVFGPRDPFSREARLCRQIIEKRPVVVPMQPFLCQNLFVRDAARAVRLLLESPGTAGRACNAGGSPFALEEYVGLLARLLGRKPLMMRASAQVLLRDGNDIEKMPYFFEGDLVLDTRRIRDEAAFEPAFGLEEALRLTLEWLTRKDGECNAAGGSILTESAIANTAEGGRLP